MEILSDRLARRFRRFIIASCVMTLPVWIVGYAVMLKTAAETWPLWSFATVALAGLGIVLSAACYYDLLAEQTQIEQHGQSGGPVPR